MGYGVGSLRTFVLSGAFLFAILFTQYPPYSRAYVCVSDGFPVGVCFLGRRSTCGLRLVPTRSIDRLRERTRGYFVPSHRLSLR
jgi:hypothetical protein